MNGASGPGGYCEKDKKTDFSIEPITFIAGFYREFRLNVVLDLIGPGSHSDAAF